MQAVRANQDSYGIPASAPVSSSAANSYSSGSSSSSAGSSYSSSGSSSGSSLSGGSGNSGFRGGSSSAPDSYGIPSSAPVSSSSAGSSYSSGSSGGSSGGFTGVIAGRGNSGGSVSNAGSSAPDSYGIPSTAPVSSNNQYSAAPAQQNSDSYGSPSGNTYSAAPAGNSYGAAPAGNSYSSGNIGSSSGGFSSGAQQADDSYGIPSTGVQSVRGGGGGQGCALQSGLRGLGLTTLTGLIESAGLVDALSGGDSDLTLFAPTDAALQTFIGGLPSAPDAATVKTVLLNHVVSGAVRAEDLSDGLSAQNLAGNSMTVRLNPVTVGGARVARTNLPVCRLTVHTLDDVINPANLPDGAQAVRANSNSYGSPAASAVQSNSNSYGAPSSYGRQGR